MDSQRDTTICDNDSMTHPRHHIHPPRRHTPTLTIGVLLATTVVAACASTTPSGEPSRSTTLVSTTAVPPTGSVTTGSTNDTAPTTTPSTSTTAEIANSTADAPPPTTAIPIAEIQAVLDASIGPSGIKFGDDSIASPPSGAVLGVRIPGQADTLLTSGTNIDGSALAADEPFVISLISRTLVESAAWLLVDKGTLDPNATLSKWLPDYPNATTITIDMLLNEQAGMGDFNDRTADLVLTNPNRRWTLAEALEIAATEPPHAQPGVFAQIPADTESIALAYILEQVTAEPIGQLVQTLVTTPLALRDTGFAEDSTAPTNIQAGAFVLDGKAVDTSQFTPTAYYTLGAPAWGAYSTAPDLLVLIDALSTGKLLGEARTPSPHAFTDDRVATNGQLYIANGDPLTGYCPCQTTADGHTVTAYGRRGTNVGTTVAVYHFPTTGITLMLHYNASDPASTGDLQDVLYKVYALVTSAA